MNWHSTFKRGTGFVSSCGGTYPDWRSVLVHMGCGIDCNLIQKNVVYHRCGDEHTGLTNKHPLPNGFDGNLFEGRLSWDKQWSVLEKIGSRISFHDPEGNSGHTYYHLPESFNLENEWKCGDIISHDMEDRVSADTFLKSLCPWGSIVGRESSGWIVSTPWPNG